ncbi:MAG: proteasome accessory factor PafA2 family protein [Nitrososphaerales archaeon]
MGQKEQTLDRWMGLEQEWAVPFRDSDGNWPEEDRFHHHESRSTYARELIYSLYTYRFNDGSSPFLWIGRNSTQRCSYLRGLLKNGGFYEHQWNHIETSSPECRNHSELALYDKANEVWMYISLLQLRHLSGLDINCWKTSVDARGVSRSTHESYDCSRSKLLPAQDNLIPFLTFRQLFSGSGGFWNRKFVISPRVMVLESVKADTAGARCILHTYDEPLISKTVGSVEPYGVHKLDRFRSHQVLGDPLRMEVSNLLKCGITSYVLSAVEEGFLNYIELDDPLTAIKEISRNTEGPWQVKVGTKSLDAVEYLSSDILQAIEKVFSERDIQDHDRYTLSRFKFVLDKLSQGLLEDLASDVQWVALRYLLDNYLDYYDSPNRNYDGLEREMATSFDLVNVAHDEVVWLDLVRGLNPSTDRTKPLKASRLFTDDDVKFAVLNPPSRSRGAFRVELAKTYPIREVDWHIVSKVGDSGLRGIGGLEGWEPVRIRNKLREFA